ncbi:MAG: Ig-like domain-containing protein [Candidatus Enteromonas sp.]
MKKKFIPIVAIAALMSLGGLATACSSGGTDVSSSIPEESTSVEDPTPSSTTPSEDTSSESTPEVIHVESVSIVLSATTIKVGETSTATVEVLPANADDKTYVIASLNEAVAIVNGTTITGVAKGTAEIQVTTNDGAKVAKATITVEEAELPAPTITNPGQASYTVAAGVDLALPNVIATSGDGKTDLTGAMEAEDFNDAHSLSADLKTFNSKVAGVHVVSYYVEEGEAASLKSATLEIEITVTPATENTFVTEGENDPAAIAEYGTFKDGFEDGYDSRLYKSLGDANQAASLSATSDAIMGNSLIVDFNKTSGSALNSLFVNTFTSVLRRGESVTYSVEFDYKTLTESGFGDVYFGMRWDGFDGINSQFISNKTVGTTSHYKVSFPETTVPEGGNAGFFFFKLSGDQTPCKVAIDNFVVTAKKTPKVTIVTPTSEQLTAEGGFTFDWKDRASTFGKGETTLVESIENETIRTGISGKEGFGENVMHLTGNDSHLFAGLDATNLIAGKKLSISFKYYKVDDGGFNMILMVSGAGLTMNDNLSMTDVDGNIKQFYWEGVVPAGTGAINFYPTNGNFDIYMGAMTVKLVDADPIPEGETALGHKVGKTWTNTSRQWGGGSVAGGQATLEVVDTPAAVTGEGIGAQISKITWGASANNTNIEWYQPGGKQIEAGHEYKITMIYFVETWNGGARLMLNFDNAVFEPGAGMDTSAGYHKYEFTWTATKAVDFFSVYVPEANGDSVIYLASSTVELVAIH